MHRHIRSRGGGARATNEASQNADNLKASIADTPLSERRDHLQDEEENGEARDCFEGNRRAEINRHILFNRTGSPTIPKSPKACNRRHRKERKDCSLDCPTSEDREDNEVSEEHGNGREKDNEKL